MNNEDIKVLEELCNSFKYQQSKLDELERDDYAELIQDIEIIAIENLIKGYKDLEKKNKRYEKYLRNKDIEHEKILEYIETEKENDYIPKSKVREIIELIDNSQPVIAELKLRKLVEGDTNETKM